MIDLITPDELMINQKTATQPVINEYSHESQRPLNMQGALDSVQLAQTMWCMSTTTFNGTQTFGGNGQPIDADSDSDNTGDC